MKFTIKGIDLGEAFGLADKIISELGLFSKV